MTSPSDTKAPGLGVLLVVEQLRRSVPGGIGTYIRGLVGGLGDLGPADPRDRAGEPLRPVALYASRPSSRPDPLGTLGLPARTSALPGKLLSRAWDAGILDVPPNFAVVHALSVLTPPSRKAPLVVTVHDLAWRHAPAAYPARGRHWHEAALARARRRADAIVVPAATVAAELGADGVDPATIHVVPHGSDHLPPPDEPGADVLLERLGVSREFLLSVGTLEPRKNLARLVDAYGRARPSLPEPWPLVVVGPRGWKGGDTATDGGAGVLTAGAVSGAVLAALYRRARLLAYVPLLEGFGFPPIEAMAAGTPVVASPMPSTGDAAVEVDPTDVDAIAGALTRVAGDDDVRAQLAHRGRAHAGAHTWAASAHTHRRLWTDLS